MKKLKVIIFGSTGMVGKGVLYECIDSENVESVLLINRSRLGIENPKVKEVVHDDFTDFSSLQNELKGYDACYFSLGVSAAGMKEEKYRRITYGFTLAASSILRKLNENMTFIYVSGVGTDTSEKGRTMWARVKGKTENDIIKLGFKDAYMYRAGYIQPEKGIKSKTKLYNALYIFSKPLYPVLKILIPNQITTTTKLGQSMINITQKPYRKKIITNRDINIIASNNY